MKATSTVCDTGAENISNHENHKKICVKTYVFYQSKWRDLNYSHENMKATSAICDTSAEMMGSGEELGEVKGKKRGRSKKAPKVPPGTRRGFGTRLLSGR